MAEFTLAENPFPIGSPAPDFSLKCVDGEIHDLGSFKDYPVLVIAAVCNHCPYVQAYLDRMVELQRKYMDSKVLFVGINSNDESRYPDDSYDNMVLATQIKGLNFHYLRDEDQSAAKAYHMERTPQFFVFDAERKLRYSGGFDDNHQDPSAVTDRPLEEAIVALLHGNEVLRPEAPSIGCSLKWKE
jgi:peroxiredoxin